VVDKRPSESGCGGGTGSPAETPGNQNTITREDAMSDADVKPTKTPRKLGARDGLFQRNGWWWLDYSDADGKRHRKKAAPDYRTAKIIYRDTMTAIAKGEVLGVREEGLRLKDFVERRYWPAVRATLAPLWAERSRAMLDGMLIPRFGDMKLSKIRREAIETWYAERLSQVSATTANKELGRLKHLLGRAIAWGYLKASPALSIKKAKEAPGRTRYLSAEERNRLLNGADVTVKAKDGRTWTALRKPNRVLRLYILAALHTGARRGELARLRWADVDMRARTITFRHTKNGHARSVPMTDTLREALATLPRPLSPEASLLPEREPKVVSRAFSRLVGDLEIPNLRFHDLRHDAASALTMAGVSQRAVMEILGHRDPRMTMRYQHLSPGHLRDAMRALDGALSGAESAALAAPAREVQQR
jgi:integrase